MKPYVLTSIAGFARSFLHIKFTPNKNFMVSVYECPGQWMQQSQIDELVADLRSIVHVGNKGGELDYGVIKGDKDALRSSIITVVRERVSLTPVAFNAMRYLKINSTAMPMTVIHLGLVVISSKHQGQRLSWLLYTFPVIALFIRKGFRDCWFSNVTQIPRVELSNN